MFMVSPGDIAFGLMQYSFHCIIRAAISPAHPRQGIERQDYLKAMVDIKASVNLVISGSS